MMILNTISSFSVDAGLQGCPGGGQLDDAVGAQKMAVLRQFMHRATQALGEGMTVGGATT